MWPLPSVGVPHVAGESRKVIQWIPRRRPVTAGPHRTCPGDTAIINFAKAHTSDGPRMVAALATREPGTPVNRKRVQRIMRSHTLLQPVRGLDRRRRPGFFHVTRPDELWHMELLHSRDRGLERRT